MVFVGAVGMRQGRTRPDPAFGPVFPSWLPAAARRYLLHTSLGLSLRDVARAEGCHASTVLRQVRQLEIRRDDPLVDAVLDRLHRARPRQGPSPHAEECPQMPHSARIRDVSGTARIDREARRILRRLCETGAFLAVAPEMDKAVVLREMPDDRTTRTAVVDREIAQAFALKDWIACFRRGRVSAYEITAAGRAALKRLLAEDRQKTAAPTGFAEAPSPYAEQHRSWETREIREERDGTPRKLRYNLAESPLTALARRRDKDGKPFLPPELVEAGERLREDFELAQMGPRITQDWDRFLTAGARPSAAAGADAADGGARSARARVQAALADLGPGLGDIALRCCCFLEGLETAEKRMGWSARSGKIVLRIALQRLRQHYAARHGSGDRLIG